jgi:hypothetical protein
LNFKIKQFLIGLILFKDYRRHPPAIYTVKLGT